MAFITARTPLVALPDSTARVAELVRYCALERIPLVPQGGNTSYCGAATPRAAGSEIVVSLRRMRKIRSIDPLDDSMTAEAGCVLAELQAAAAAANRLLPMSLGSEGSCTLGGIVSTNAGGTSVLRYGMMRALVLGLEVVLPDGRVLDQLSALRKDNTGYDLKQLFIGAEGTLGIVTAASLRLFPRPAATATALAALESPAAALELLARLRDALGDSVTTFELVPRIAMEFVCRHIEGARDPFGQPHEWYALIEASIAAGDAEFSGRFEDALASAMDRGTVADAVTAASESQRKALWRLRETIPEAQRHEGASLKHDISVAPARLPTFIEEGRALVAATRAGRATRRLWPSWRRKPALQPQRTGRRGRRAADGGVRRHPARRARPRGRSRRQHQRRARNWPAEGRRTRALREPGRARAHARDQAAIDPHGIMNPGKVLRDQSEAAPMRRTRKNA